LNSRAGPTSRLGDDDNYPAAEFHRRNRKPIYGSGHFVELRGTFPTQRSEDKDERVASDMKLEIIEEARRIWQFYRDRRPETYEAMVELAP
jgi:hypothetical protein